MEKFARSFLSPQQYAEYYLKLRIIKRTVMRDLKESDLVNHASAMAYISIFSLVPSLAAIFALISLFIPIVGQQNKLYDMANKFILQNLATGTGDVVIAHLRQFLETLDIKKIGFTSLLSLFISLILLLRQVEQALNRIWKVSRSRNMFVRFIYFWTFITLGTFLLTMILGLSADFKVFQTIKSLELGGAIYQKSGLALVISSLTSWGTWVLFFYLAYKIIPNCVVRTRSALIGALVAATLIYAGSVLYGIYVRDFNNYKTIYGTLAAIPIFLMWIYICWIIAIAGATVAWRIQIGFPQANEDQVIFREISAVETYRNVQIRAYLPFIVLSLVYERFQEGGGQGVEAHEIASLLKVPDDWVLNCIELLEMKSFLIEGDMTQSNKEIRQKIFPAKPIEKINIEKFFVEMQKESHLWFTDHKDKTKNPAIMHILDELKVKFPGNKTMAELLSTKEGS